MMYGNRDVVKNNYLGGAGCSRDILKYNSTNFHVIQTTKIENYDDNFSVLCMDTICFLVDDKGNFENLINSFT